MAALIKNGTLIAVSSTFEANIPPEVLIALLGIKEPDVPYDPSSLD